MILRSQILTAPFAADAFMEHLLCCRPEHVCLAGSYRLSWQFEPSKLAHITSKVPPNKLEQQCTNGLLRKW